MEKDLKGGKMLGYFTSKKRNNILDSQILVTVPACLEILLLSVDEKSQKWRNNLKYVIIDEVQSINGENGQYLERILQIIPCPIIVLSSTIKYPVNFCEWLTSIEKTKPLQDFQKELNFKKEERFVELISSNNRYNDLIHFYYQNNQLIKLSSTFAFSGTYIRANGFHESIFFSSKECFRLYNLLVNNPKIVFPKRLQPIKFFKKDVNLDSSLLISKCRVLEYQKELENFLKTLPVNKVEKIFEKFNKTIPLNCNNKNIANFAFLLKTKEMLPAIFFEFTIEKCKNYFNDLVKYLEEKDTNNLNFYKIEKPKRKPERSYEFGSNICENERDDLIDIDENDKNDDDDSNDDDDDDKSTKNNFVTNKNKVRVLLYNSRKNFFHFH
eukprot:TRINITY_DN9525_c0_g1_i1.p1 TRINITY_DN9525_c0_g1~~TRINITY_DN9525_c0_g1_i1.p1  ORF type:complete len:383 (-),score=82.05 TRINITY_DN9525_c0_g1_i1:219-1367(-)